MHGSFEGTYQMFGSQAKRLWYFWDGVGVGSDGGKQDIQVKSDEKQASRGER